MIVKSIKIAQTRELAREMAKKMLGSPTSRGKSDFRAVVLALVGDLGSGKTTFARAFLKALGVKERVVSPTFLLMRKYEVGGFRLKGRNDSGHRNDKKNVYHVDAYRVAGAKELIDLGFKDILKDKNNIVLVEWADRIKKIIPKNAVWIYFEHKKKENERIIKIIYN